MTPLERAARALARREGEMQEAHGSTSKPPEQWADERWPDHLGTARAVLTAIREPSEAMEDAGWIAGTNQNSPNAMRDAWQSMIDAALAEEE